METRDGFCGEDSIRERLTGVLKGNTDFQQEVGPTAACGSVRVQAAGQVFPVMDLGGDTASSYGTETGGGSEGWKKWCGLCWLHGRRGEWELCCGGRHPEPPHALPAPALGQAFPSCLLPASNAGGEVWSPGLLLTPPSWLSLRRVKEQLGGQNVLDYLEICFVLQ